MALCNILQRFRVFGTKDIKIGFHAVVNRSNSNRVYLYIETLKSTSLTCWTKFYSSSVSEDDIRANVADSQSSSLTESHGFSQRGDFLREDSQKDMAIVSTVQINTLKLGAFVSSWPLDASRARIRFSHHQKLTIIVDDDINVQIRIMIPHESR